MITQVLEGDARSVLCEAAEKYGATILVLGCHGYGAIKRYMFKFDHLVVDHLI